MSLRASALPAVLLSVALVLGASACSEDEPTPEEARAERVEERLKLSFTDEQVDCMMEQFGEAVLISLDGEGKMPQSGAELEEFTSVAQACVIGSGDTVVESPTDETEGSTAPSAEDTSSTSPTPDSTAPETTSPETTASAGDEGTGGGPATRPEPAAGADDDEGGQGNGRGNGRGNSGNSGNGGDRGNGPDGGRGSGDGESDDD